MDSVHAVLFDYLIKGHELGGVERVCWTVRTERLVVSTLENFDLDPA